MKQLFILSCCLFFGLISNAQTDVKKISLPDTTKKILQVETACGQCKFHLQGKGCDLAVRIDGKAYFVDGTSIDDHGDAHASDGFCLAIRRAEVQGTVVNNRFKATYFKLLPNPPAVKPKSANR